MSLATSHAVSERFSAIVSLYLVTRPCFNKHHCDLAARARSFVSPLSISSPDQVNINRAWVSHLNQGLTGGVFVLAELVLVRFGWRRDRARIVRAEMPSPTEIHFANPSQLSLLRAALLEGPPAAEAAQNWVALLRDGEAESGFHGLDLASRRLLPLVYRNAKKSIPAQLGEKLKLVHHEYWAENQRRFWRLQQLLPW